ncbi:MAG: hypothetical protein ACW99Q_13515, partial [Candidatus Kariarchaeaceae archaeon]
LVIGYNLETSKVGFIAEVKSIPNAIVRYLIGIICSIGVLRGLDYFIADVLDVDDHTIEGFILRFIRYIFLGLVATLGVGKIFVSIGLADVEQSTEQAV